MITHIRVKNFKSWEDSGEVKLAALTGFFGTNSSGKSSLLQMLLLLKQTAERSEREEVIFFGDGNSFVNLGNFQEMIHGHNSKASLELEFGCQIQNPFTIEVKGPSGFSHLANVRLDIDSFTFATAVRKEDEGLVIQYFRYGIDSDPELVQWRKGNYLHYGNRAVASGTLKNCYSLSEIGFNSMLTQFSLAFEDLFSHVYYLGPTRVEPQRYYQWGGGHPQHIRRWGNQTIDALLSARVRKLKTLHKEEEVPIEDRVSEWLREMELAYSFTLDWKTQGSKEYEVRIQKTSSSPPVTLVDMGYGLGQFLPVLVLCYYAPEGSTLILEQPGIHLHPKVQSQLADLLIEVITERNLQILVESHSEHLLNRLQRRVAEERIAADQTALYFCRNDEGISNIDRLKMDEFGNITNWPENFFGDEMGDLFAMTKAQRERQKKAEG